MNPYLPRRGSAPQKRPMKILFVTNYFPPHYIGGYELHCGRAARWLCRAGHDVHVLTSDFSLGDELPELRAPGIQIDRELRLRYWTDVASLGYWARERRDLALFRRRLREFRPDMVVLWNMSKLASGIVLEAQRRAPLLVYHLMDEWAANFRTGNGLPQFWARPARSLWGRLAKPPLRRLYRLLFTPDASQWRPRHAVLVSKALGELLERHGVAFENTHVSYITYDPELFETAETEPPPPADADAPVRFLWAGRMCEGKGLVTTLKALDVLHERRPSGWTLDFCGPVDEETEREILRPSLESAPWRRSVRYLGSLPHEELPRQYRSHDVFLFTSEVHEGLPGTIVEAFACALPVIGTLTGGTKDVLRPEENCLVYPMGDSRALAGAMLRTIEDRALRRRLSARVARFARDHCSNDAVFPKLVEFYNKLLQENRTPEGQG